MRRGCPGSANLIRDEARWRAYIRDALVEPSIEIDMLARARVDKPALLRRLFELGCNYSGQIVSLDNVSHTRAKTVDADQPHCQAGSGLQPALASRRRALMPPFLSEFLGRQ